MSSEHQLQALEAALARDPADPGAWLALARLADRTGRRPRTPPLVPFRRLLVRLLVDNPGAQGLATLALGSLGLEPTHESKDRPAGSWWDEDGRAGGQAPWRHDRRWGMPLRARLWRPGPRAEVSFDLSWVPPGTFWTASADRSLAPPSTGGFYLSTFPVHSRVEGGVDAGALWPVTDWTFQQAQDQAQVHGGRLPRHFEWEKAATGLEPRRYPWGEDPPGLGRISERLLRYPSQEWADFPSAVGAAPEGASPFGLQDMVGNIFEWTDDWWRIPDPDDPEDAGERQVRGGWNLERTGPAGCGEMLGMDPEETSPVLGFRVLVEVLDAEGRAV